MVKALESPLSGGFVTMIVIRSLLTHVQFESQIKKVDTMVDRGIV